VVPGLIDPATKRETQAQRRTERKAYFAELSKWAGLRTDHELKVLDGGTYTPSSPWEVRLVDRLTPV